MSTRTVPFSCLLVLFLLSVFGLACGGASSPPPDLVDTRSPAALDHDCRGGDFEACATLGWLIYAGATDAGEAPRVFGLFQRACGGGSGEGCSGLGLNYFDGFGVAQDFDRAVESWGRACELDSGSGCAYLGVAYLFGLGTSPNPVGALSVWQKACDLGEAEGCRFAADLLIQQGPTRDVTAAVDLWERACDLGDPEGCITLGRQLYTGTHVAMDRAMALAWFEQACELGAAGGCVNAGNLHRYGEGTDVDLDVALTFYDRACDLLDSRGCQLHDTVSAYRECRDAGRYDCGEPEGGLDILECTSETGFGVVTLTDEQWASRYAAGATELRDLRTSIERPAEVCSLDGELDFLMGLHCADGSRPFSDRDEAHRFRLGNVGPGGRCGRTIDLYAVPCPEGTYQVYLDMYMCPTREPGQSL